MPLKLFKSRLFRIPLIVFILACVVLPSIPLFHVDISQFNVHFDFPSFNQQVSAAPSDRYWVGDSGNWNDTAHWDLHSGGAGGDAVPDNETTVYFDAASFTGGGQTVTVNVASVAASVVFTDAADAPDLAMNATLTVGGNVTFLAGVTVSGASAIIVTGTGNFDGAGITFPVLQLNGSAHTLSGANTFTTLTRTGTAADTTLTLAANQTITGTLTLAGNSINNRLTVQSSVHTTQRTLTAAVVTPTNVDFHDTVAAGASSPWDVSAIAGGSVDLGNNSNITFSVNRYWVGASGTWSDAANHWAFTSGGVADVVFLPTSTLNVYFDANSFTGGGQTVTLNNAGADGYCLDMDWTGALFNPTFDIASSASTHLYISGTLTTIANMSITNSGHGFGWVAYMDFNSTAVETITTNGLSLSAIDYITFDGVGGSWTLQDALVASTVGLTNGTLDTNDKTVTIVTFSSSNANVRVVDFGTSTVNISSSWDTGTSTNLTVSGGNYNIILTGTASFSGGGVTQANGTVQLNGTSHTISGTNTFNNLTRTGTATTTDSVTFSANQTITGTLTINGNSEANRVLVQSDTIGTARTLTAAAVSISNADFQDITGAGAASPFATTFTGNLGGNSNITFTVASDQYWVGNSGTQTDDAHWANASGGVAGSGHVPLAQDNANFDLNSFTIGGQIVTLVDEYRIGNIISTGVLNAPQFGDGTAKDVQCYGSVTNGVATWSLSTSAIKFYERAANTITTSGVTMPAIEIGSSTGHGVGGTITLQDVYISSSTITLYRGTLDLNDQNATATKFVSTTNTYTRTLTMGSGTFTLNVTDASDKWDIDVTNLTVNRETSTILLTNSTANGQGFDGGSLIYNNVTIAGTGNYTLTFNSACTINILTITRSSAAKTIAGNVTLTITDLSIPVSGVTVVTITNTDFTKTTGTVSSDYLTISGSTAAGGAAFYAGTHSTDSGGNAGWSFTAPVVPTLTTLAATGLTNTDATLNGTIDGLGGYPSGYVDFEYTLVSGVYPSFDTTDQFTAAIGAFTANLTGLTVDTVYFYRIRFRYNLTQYVYGGEQTFTTTGSPIVTTSSAVGVTSTSAILVGSLTSLGVYLNCDVSFEYGTTIAYGSESPPVTYTAIGAASYPLGGLTSNTTYHYRIKVTFAGASSPKYGVDVTFTTPSAGSTILTITSAGAFKNYIETGDLLITAEVINKYTSYYPNLDPKQYFQIQLLNVAGTTILGATPLWSWGDVPTSIYFDEFQAQGGRLTNGTGTATYTTGLAYKLLSGATTVTITATGTFTIVLPPGDGGTAISGTATLAGTPVTLTAGSNSINVTAIPGGGGTIIVTPNNLTEGAAYIVRMIGINIAGTPSVSHTMTATEWYGTDLDSLDEWILGVAWNMNTNNSWWGTSNDMLNPVTDTGVTLTDKGGAYFTNGIQGISVIRPDLFSITKNTPSFTQGTANNVFDTSTTWIAQVGAIIQADATAFGNLFNATGQIALGYLIGALILLIVIFAVSNGAKPLGMLLICVPLIIVGNYLRVIGIQITVVLAATCVFLFVRQFWWKST